MIKLLGLAERAEEAGQTALADVMEIIQTAEVLDGKKLRKFAEDAVIISSTVMGAIGEESNA